MIGVSPPWVCTATSDGAPRITVVDSYACSAESTLMQLSCDADLLTIVFMLRR